MTQTPQHPNAPSPPVSPTFEFATATRIIFGPGSLREIAPLAKQMGQRTMVVVGSSANSVRRAEPLLIALITQGLSNVTFPVDGEPTIDCARSGAQRARDERCDLVIGFGGGSALDAGKAIAALATNRGDPLDYLEVIGKGKPLAKPSLPYFAVPTTAGTGTEVTRNAVLGSPEHRIKVSLRSPWMLPRGAIVDPDLTADLPPAITANTGLDALTQLIEPFVSKRANPLTDAICREGIHRLACSLRRAYEHGDDKAAREDMSLASLFGGLALSNASLGAVHGFAAPLGGMFPAPHGALCAALLPHTMEINVRALQNRAPSSEALQRYDEVARIVTGKQQATAMDGVSWVKELCAALQIRPLRAYGVNAEDFAPLVEKASKANSMKGNPVALTAAEMTEILNCSL